jgi:hypothetical protein
MVRLRSGWDLDDGARFGRFPRPTTSHHPIRCSSADGGRVARPGSHGAARGAAARLPNSASHPTLGSPRMLQRASKAPVRYHPPVGSIAAASRSPRWDQPGGSAAAEQEAPEQQRHPTKGGMPERPSTTADKTRRGVAASFELGRGGSAAVIRSAKKAATAADWCESRLDLLHRSPGLAVQPSSMVERVRGLERSMSSMHGPRSPRSSRAGGDKPPSLKHDGSFMTNEQMIPALRHNDRLLSLHMKHTWRSPESSRSQIRPPRTQSGWVFSGIRSTWCIPRRKSARQRR